MSSSDCETDDADDATWATPPRPFERIAIRFDVQSLFVDYRAEFIISDAAAPQQVCVEPSVSAEAVPRPQAL